jgi:BASS family bile acid:Na+ symporter
MKAEINPSEKGRRTMSNDNPVHRLSSFVHHHFLPLLVGAYFLAWAVPAPGLFLRGVELGEVALLGEQVRLSLPTVLLGFMLLNAGLGVDAAQLRGLLSRPAPLLAGLLGNLLVPVCFVLVLCPLLGGWANLEGAHGLLVGLALVVSLPIAGSSTAWSRQANADLALSLGLVVCSVCLSPVTTPALLYVLGLAVDDGAGPGLQSLAGGGTGLFLAAFVLLPSLAGILGHKVIGPARLRTANPSLKLLNALVVLVLNYSNAAVALPRALAEPDAGFLAVTTAVVLALCAVNFLSGWGLGRLLRVGPARQASLMFALGMNNNGTGLVLAATALAALPGAMLPLIVYTLVQHLAAGVAERSLRKDEAPAVAVAPARPMAIPSLARRAA